MTQQIPTSEVLNRAADLIEGKGWATGDGWPGTNVHGHLCLEGGIAAALGISANYNDWSDPEVGVFEACPAYQAVANHLEYSMSLYWWNDAPGRTAAEVIEVLRATAVIEAAREQQPAEVSA